MITYHMRIEVALKAPLIFGITEQKDIKRWRLVKVIALQVRPMMGDRVRLMDEKRGVTNVSTVDGILIDSCKDRGGDAMGVYLKPIEFVGTECAKAADEVVELLAKQGWMED